MNTCPDCAGIKEQVRGSDKYEVIDIGEHVKSLKEFLKLRDANPAFAPVKAQGSIGIPCFLREDGTPTFDPVDVGLQPIPSVPTPNSCRLDGSGC